MLKSRSLYTYVHVHVHVALSQVLFEPDVTLTSLPPDSLLFLFLAADSENDTWWWECNWCPGSFSSGVASGRTGEENTGCGVAPGDVTLGFMVAGGSW